MSRKIKELREKRAEVVAQMQEIASNAAKEDRDLTNDELQKSQQLREESKNIRHQYEELEAIDAEQRELSTFKEASDRVEQDMVRMRGQDNVITRADGDLAFRAWTLAQSDQDVPSEMREAAEKCGVPLGSNKLGGGKLMWRAKPMSRREAQDIADGMQYRATTAQTITTTGGGYTFTSSLMEMVEVQLVRFGGMRQVANVMRSDSGETMLFPTIDDSVNTGAVLGINTAASVDSLVFGQTSITPFKYTSNIVKVPMELAQDTAVNLPALVGELLGIRIARITNTHFTVGSTAGTQPVGAITRAPGTVTATTANSRRPTYALLKQLEHGVDPAYRPNASFMMSDEVLSQVEQLVDSDGNPIFRPSNNIGQADLLFRYPTIINQAMATSTGTAAKIVGFGDFSKYVIRDIRDRVDLTLVERYAELAQVGYLMFSRHGGEAIFATTGSSKKPIQCMVQST
jgi:HK97 family phage major capsid protein